MSEHAQRPREISPEHAHYEALVPLTAELLADTAFVQDRAFTPADVEATRSYLLEAAKYANPALFPNFWDTTLLAALYARRLTEKIQPEDLQPDEAEALNLMHDIGRLISPGQYYRNDLLADSMLRKAGLRQAALDKIPDLGRILGIRGEPLLTVDDATPAHRILNTADYLGKRTPTGELVTPDQIIEASLKSFVVYKNTAIWPSAHAGMVALSNGRDKLAIDLFQTQVAWCERQGVDLEAIRQTVQADSTSAENLTWIATAQRNASTLVH